MAWRGVACWGPKEWELVAGPACKRRDAGIVQRQTEAARTLSGMRGIGRASECYATRMAWVRKMEGSMTTVDEMASVQADSAAQRLQFTRSLLHHVLCLPCRPSGQSLLLLRLEPRPEVNHDWPQRLQDQALGNSSRSRMCST